jgi:hypothetical protein
MSSSNHSSYTDGADGNQDDSEGNILPSADENSNENIETVSSSTTKQINGTLNDVTIQPLAADSVEIKDETFMMRVVNKTLYNSQTDETSAELSSTRKQPELECIANDEGPPHPGIYTESAQDVEAVMEEKMSSINATSSSNKAASVSTVGHMEYIEAEPPLPLGTIPSRDSIIKSSQRR